MLLVLWKNYSPPTTNALLLSFPIKFERTGVSVLPQTLKPATTTTAAPSLQNNYSYKISLFFYYRNGLKESPRSAPTTRLSSTMSLTTGCWRRSLPRSSSLSLLSLISWESTVVWLVVLLRILSPRVWSRRSRTTTLRSFSLVSPELRASKADSFVK